MMIFACLMVVSLMMCNDFSRQGRLVAGRGKGLRGSISEVWTAGHGGVKGRGRGRANLSLWALYLLFFCVLCEKKNVFEIRWGVFSLTEHTEASPPAPLRMERGVLCEVTPIGRLAYFVEVFLFRWWGLSLSLVRFFSHTGEVFLSQNTQI